MYSDQQLSRDNADGLGYDAQKNTLQVTRLHPSSSWDLCRWDVAVNHGMHETSLNFICNILRHKWWESRLVWNWLKPRMNFLEVQINMTSAKLDNMIWPWYSVDGLQKVLRPSDDSVQHNSRSSIWARSLWVTVISDKEESTEEYEWARYLRLLRSVLCSCRLTTSRWLPCASAWHITNAWESHSGHIVVHTWATL